MKLLPLLLLPCARSFLLPPPLSQLSPTRESALSPLRSLPFIDVSSFSSFSSLDPSALSALSPLPPSSLSSLLSTSLSTSTAVSPTLSALAAYSHFLGLILVVASLITERLTLCNPAQREEDFDKGFLADTMYGLASVLILVSGYFRVTQYGKGWDFYAHEPAFWVRELRELRELREVSHFTFISHSFHIPPPGCYSHSYIH